MGGPGFLAVLAARGPDAQERILALEFLFLNAGLRVSDHFCEFKVEPFSSFSLGMEPRTTTVVSCENGSLDEGP